MGDNQIETAMILLSRGEALEVGGDGLERELLSQQAFPGFVEKLLAHVHRTIPRVAEALEEPPVEHALGSDTDAGPDVRDLDGSRLELPELVSKACPDPVIQRAVIDRSLGLQVATKT